MNIGLVNFPEQIYSLIFSPFCDLALVNNIRQLLLNLQSGLSIKIQAQDQQLNQQEILQGQGQVPQIQQDSTIADFSQVSKQYLYKYIDQRLIESWQNQWDESTTSQHLCLAIPDLYLYFYFLQKYISNMSKRTKKQFFMFLSGKFTYSFKQRIYTKIRDYRCPFCGANVLRDHVFQCFDFNLSIFWINVL
eukprot:TRINITY_DN1890_c0_g3_i18.p1 TRINITY_DN1890_c0_g3~~TRINITY_DN1890_c0_g3_i18.p1  ORF type:complete len:191 (-),score=-9.99 TRINITY_DN1890_c0_g3_i18:11-583(-)